MPLWLQSSLLLIIEHHPYVYHSQSMNLPTGGHPTLPAPSQYASELKPPSHYILVISNPFSVIPWKGGVHESGSALFPSLVPEQ